MRKVLHYKTNFLNKSETFIDRLVSNHQLYQPLALCYKSKSFTDHIQIFQVPEKGLSKQLNRTAFHLNLPLPFYYKCIKQQQPDVIHAHFGYDGMKMLRLANMFDIPLIVSFYGSDVSRLPSEFGWKRRYRKLARFGSHFIAATQFMKKQLIKLGFNENKITVVRFGVDLQDSPFILRKRYPNKFMMVGRMVEKKGFKYAIKAIHILKKRGYDVHLDLFGNGPLMKNLNSLTRDLSLNGVVTFHGYQPIETILNAHAEYSLLLAPSVIAKDGDMEGLPNTILEAMAKGTPVVASRHAAIPEVIENFKTGFLVDEGDAEGLADTLENILQEKYNLEQIRRNARKVIEEEYTADRMVSEVEHIYNQSLK